MITLRFECDRLLCDEAIDVVENEEVELGGQFGGEPGEQTVIVSGWSKVGEFLPPGWGWDAHNGPDTALHCPAHRQKPTPEESEAIQERARALGVID